MPYDWTKTDDPAGGQELRLWPHQSLPPAGFVLFIGVTLFMVTLPLMPVLGTALLWGLLPFIALAVGGVWYAIHRSRLAARVFEVLTLTETTARLERHDPSGQVRAWECNRYWARPQMHIRGGPVPNYVTLRGSGREVEIGAFLSENERKALYGELMSRLRA